MDIDYFKANVLRILYGVMICLFVVLVEGAGWMQSVYSWGNFVLEPANFWSGRVVVGVEDFFSTVFEIGSLRSENSELKIDNAKLEAENSKTKEILEENEALRKQVGIEGVEKNDLQLVRILGIDKNGLSDHIIIDAGKDEDISKGDIVVLGDMLIGEIRDSYETTSRVRLVSNQKSNIIAIDQQTRAKGLVHGSLEGIVMEEVLESEELNEGDVVLAWSENIPSGLVIGKISRIEVLSTSSTQKAYLETGLNVEDLSYVFVVLN